MNVGGDRAGRAGAFSRAPGRLPSQGSLAGRDPRGHPAANAVSAPSSRPVEGRAGRPGPGRMRGDRGKTLGRMA
ncbi:protein of unknown function [Streptomyces murinus]